MVDGLQAAAGHAALLPGPVSLGSDVQDAAAYMPLVSHSTPGKGLRGTACPGCPIDMTLTESGLVDCCSELQSEALPLPSKHSSLPGFTCALIT